MPDGIFPLLFSRCEKNVLLSGIVSIVYKRFMRREILMSPFVRDPLTNRETVSFYPRVFETASAFDLSDISIQSAGSLCVFPGIGRKVTAQRTENLEIPNGASYPGVSIIAK